MGLLDQAKPFGDKPKHYNICLYGEPGIGKSVLAARAPNPVTLQCERNAALSYLNHPELVNIPILDIQEPDKVIDLFWELKKGGAPEIKTIIIDTASELQMRQLAVVWKSEQKKGKRPEGHPYQQDYKINTEFMREIILLYCDLPRHVIFVCHQTDEKNDLDGNILTRPTFTPKLAATMFAAMDIMAHMSMEVNAIKNTEQRVIRVTPTRSIKAKDRLGLPSTFDADKFWELIGG